MGSLDVEALFTNLPLEETVDICANSLFQNQDLVSNLNQNDFRTLLEYATEDPWFIFDNKFYKQVDGVAMGSPLGPTLSNIFLCFHEKTWLENCPREFKPVFYRRFVDDIFVMFKSKHHLKEFSNYMNTCHPRMKFTTECEDDNVMPFLDLKFTRVDNKITSSVYRKPTFTGIYSHFDSHLPLTYKRGLIMTLLFRIFHICSNFKLIIEEVNKLKIIMSKNGYPLSFTDKCIKIFFDKIYTVKPTHSTVEKKQLWLTLPFLGKDSLLTKNKIKTLFNKCLPFANVRIIFKCNRRLSNIFTFKDKIPRNLLSHLIYSYKCTRCNSCYHGMSERHSYIRLCDHMGISWRTNKKIVGVPTEIKSHFSRCDGTITRDEFKFLASDQNLMRLKIKESILIKRDRPNLNINVFSTPLYLF